MLGLYCVPILEQINLPLIMGTSMCNLFHCCLNEEILYPIDNDVYLAYENVLQSPRAG